jgi:hypothetical protein
MTVNDPIPSADDADHDYPATSHDTVSDETEAIAPVTPGQRH